MPRTSGDNVTLLYVPGEGVRVQVSNKVDVTIKSPAFAQALWEVYLGAKPLDEGLKKRTARPSRPVTWARGETSRGPYRRRDSSCTWSWKRLWARTPRFSHGDWITVSWSAGSKPRHRIGRHCLEST
ncbi:chalcone isomerase family protein [Gemmata massiliana]|uniref:chalcone isomerase family protein n=1 Tax=Gemmata massiliana TaxID=1210884 RepID=UPI0036F2C6BF